MNLSPIILFVYNRPDHTAQTLFHLKENTLAKSSELYVYSDGPKSNMDVLAVNKVRDIIKNINGFKQVTIVEREKNYGLANNIILGVSQIIKNTGRVIVLEDDLLTSKYFLQFMNSALEFYSDSNNIFTISGYSYLSSTPLKYEKEVYISTRSSSYGWGTWLNRWELIDWDIKDFEVFVKNKKMVKKFNEYGNLTQMLSDQISGKINSWAIRRTFTQFKLGQYTLFPLFTLVKNIGFDGSGVHKAKISPIDHNYDYFQKEQFDFDNNLLLDAEIGNQLRKLHKDSFLKKLIAKIRLLIS